MSKLPFPSTSQSLLFFPPIIRPQVRRPSIIFRLLPICVKHLFGRRRYIRFYEKSKELWRWYYGWERFYQWDIVRYLGNRLHNLRTRIRHLTKIRAPMWYFRTAPCQLFLLSLSYPEHSLWRLFQHDPKHPTIPEPPDPKPKDRLLQEAIRNEILLFWIR